jgi:hypothetical protein
LQTVLAHIVCLVGIATGWRRGGGTGAFLDPRWPPGVGNWLRGEDLNL